MNNQDYKKTVDLLLEVLPYSLKDERVALKGGTAINLFYRDFPRFSVDIDLCYLPLEDRVTTFKNLHEILLKMKEDIEQKLNLKVTSSVPLDGQKEAKLFVFKEDIQIKIEPNFVLRSSLYPSNEITLSSSAIKEFEKSLTVRCLSFADVYGGKICAALDRQHPRDLYDVKYLLEKEGISAEVKDSFIFYLISHNRPINEILGPNFKDITREYNEEFVNMAKTEVGLEQLIEVRKRLVENLISTLNENDKKFLISFVSNEPNWSLVRDKKIKDYPSILWKLQNQSKMNKDKSKIYLEKVSNLFE